MGFHAQHMTRSEKLAKMVAEYEQKEDYSLAEMCDMTSTRGYDNDGSIGPELLDNGIGLGMSARDYDPKAIVFFAFGNETCYYLYGKNEEDAIRRLRELLAA